jgi:hypothetical protein
MPRILAQQIFVALGLVLNMQMEALSASVQKVKRLISLLNSNVYPFGKFRQLIEVLKRILMTIDF